MECKPLKVYVTAPVPLSITLTEVVTATWYDMDTFVAGNVNLEG